MARARGALTTAERFWIKVEKTDGCWVWCGAVSANAYGNFKVRSYVNTPAHRYSYELARGPIPVGLVLDHLCRNTLCVRPDHLEPVTQGENMYRGEAPSARNRRKSVCDRGHDLVGCYVNPGTGYRKCRPCHAEDERARRARRKTAASRSAGNVREAL